jgi:hypothetical protein
MADPTIPDEVVAAYWRASWAARVAGADCVCGDDDAIRSGLAAALPVLAAHIRAEIAEEIAQAISAEPNPYRTGIAHWSVWSNATINHATLALRAAKGGHGG